jgi:hypothetical protein
MSRGLVPDSPLPEIRLLGVPDTAPPYDDLLAGDDPPVTCDMAAGDTAGDGTAAGDSTAGGATGGPPGAAAEWQGRFAQVLAETLAGSRTAGQIAPWTSVQARRRIRQLGPLLAAGTAPRVRRILTTQPAADVVEMTMVVGFGDRVRAVAVRLERDTQRDRQEAWPRWVCTAVEAA